MKLENILLIVVLMLSLLPVGVVCLRTWTFDRLSYTMAIYTFASLCSNMLMLLLMHYFKYNLPVVHLFWSIQAVLLGRLYVLAFADSPGLAQTVVWLSALLLAYALFNALPLPDWTDGWRNMPSRTLASQGLFFTILSLIYFYRLFTTGTFVSVERLPMFWFNSGILIYFALNIYAFAFWRQMLEAGERDLNNRIHLGISLLTYLFYTFGFLCRPQPTHK